MTRKEDGMRSFKGVWADPDGMTTPTGAEADLHLSQSSSGGIQGAFPRRNALNGRVSLEARSRHLQINTT